jgi:hypothetical protein
VVAACGDGFCSDSAADYFEPFWCLVDCGLPATCGNGSCEPTDAILCAEDCPSGGLPFPIPVPIPGAGGASF